MFDFVCVMVLLGVLGYVGLYWLVGFFSGGVELPESIQSDVEDTMLPDVPEMIYLPEEDEIGGWIITEYPLGR